MSDHRVTGALDQLRRDQAAEHRAALVGIESHIRHARLHAERCGSTVPELLEVLHNVELHAQAVLGAGMLPGRGTQARIHAPRRADDAAISLERCVQLLFDPAGHIGRMRLDRFLALALDPADADELVADHRLAGSRAVSTLALPERAALAAAVRSRTRA